MFSVPEDVCLLGCIFYIADYQKCVKATTLDIWRQVQYSYQSYLCTFS